MLARHFQSNLTPDGSQERPSVVGLVRVSTLAQSEDGGLLRQYSVINKTVERKGLNLIKIFEVVDVSGTEVLRCPAVLELLHLVETRQVQGICVADLDRLFRPDKPSDYAILGVFQTTGAIIFCGDSELDLSTKNGMLFGQIRSAISGFELSIMKERQEGGKNEKRIRGKCPTPRITMPKGTEFDRVLDKWVYTPEFLSSANSFSCSTRRASTIIRSFPG
ncbi:MAG: recombinase family protein [Verrucomicrobiota bacterium]